MLSQPLLNLFVSAASEAKHSFTVPKNGKIGICTSTKADYLVDIHYKWPPLGLSSRLPDRNIIVSK